MHMDLCAHAKSLQPCPTPCDPMDCSAPDFSVHGILQARILEWVATPFSRGSSPFRNRTHISYVSCTGRQGLYLLAPPGEPIWMGRSSFIKTVVSHVLKSTGQSPPESKVFIMKYHERHCLGPIYISNCVFCPLFTTDPPPYLWMWQTGIPTLLDFVPRGPQATSIASLF